MNKPNVLIVADKEDAKVLPIESQTRHWRIFWEIIDYDELHKKVDEIKRLVLRNNIHFVLYSRNDQVGNRISIGPVTRRLRTGYSSFSGIDEHDRVNQMKTCFEDFMSCEKRLDLGIPRKRGNLQKTVRGVRTFSLIFDTEQLGCVEYGLPRIFAILQKYSARATFFVTNLMQKVYRHLVEEIRERGHEVGLHGMWHEFLSDFDEKKQTSLIQDMLSEFSGEVCGANFIGRMNEDTLRALTRNRISYFVLPLVSRYSLIAFSKPDATPKLVHLRKGKIWMLPISLETYGSPWFSIKNMIDRVLSQNGQTPSHVSILCHPFRDGNLAHINITERMLYYLIKKGLMSVTLMTVKERLERGLLPSLDVDGGAIFSNQREERLLLPRTRQDFFSIIPEHMIRIYRTLNRGHTLF